MEGIAYPVANGLARHIARSFSQLRMSPAQVKERIAGYAPPGHSASPGRLEDLKASYWGSEDGRKKAIELLFGRNRLQGVLETGGFYHPDDGGY